MGSNTKRSIFFVVIFVVDDFFLNNCKKILVYVYGQKNIMEYGASAC